MKQKESHAPKTAKDLHCQVLKYGHALDGLVSKAHRASVPDRIIISDTLSIIDSMDDFYTYELLPYLRDQATKEGQK